MTTSYRPWWPTTSKGCEKKPADGSPIGTSNPNPILNSRHNMMKFVDGHEEDFIANLIAENLYSSIIDEGHRRLFLNEITDHCSKNAPLT